MNVSGTSSETVEAGAGELARQQAALRRVATLAAEGAAGEDLFAALAEEIASVVGLPMVTMSRFEPDDSFTIVGSANNPEFPVGSRWPFDGPSLAATVRETGRPARIDDYSELPGHVAAAVRGAAMRGAVGAPIVVDGRVWGHISLAATDIELPADAEERLAGFAELVSTAIANRAARDELQALASEQAALRRVATVVAGDAAPMEVFAAVAREVGELFDVPGISMVRFGPDGGTTEIGGWGLENPFPPGTLCDQHPGVDRLVWETGKPARIRSYAELDGYVAETLAAAGFTWAIGAPIVVEGRTWGAMAAMSRSSEQPQEDAENRLSSFTELVATALANAQSGEDLRALADEQAALQRVATLVAEGVRPTEIFAAVTHEVERVFALDHDPAAAATVVRFDPNSECVLVGAAREIWETPLGMRWQPHPLFVSTRVLWTGRPARVEETEFKSAEGPDAEKLRLQGYFCQVGSPIVVDGRLWGAMTLSARDTLPPTTEERLEKFTELAATAIANADSREKVETLADEQASLRRVATLIARRVPPDEIFAAVATEVAQLFDLPWVGVMRYDADDSFTVVATWGPHPFSAGSRWPMDGPSHFESVCRTGLPGRIEDYAALPGTVAAHARASGIVGGIGAPIVVEGDVWGVVAAPMIEGRTIPVGTEIRLGQFTELVATAIANAAGRERLARLGEQQEALRRVATLVASQPSPDEVFTAVTEAVGPLLGADLAAMHVFPGDGAATVIAGWSAEGPMLPLGTRLPLDCDSVAARIFRTASPARMDDYGDVGGETAEVARDLRLRSTVGAPIVVEGRLWGALMAATRGREPLSDDAETRIAAFTELVATAISNAESRSELADSRARVIAAADDARRRIERDLHDGAQQRLVTLAVALRRVEGKAPTELRPEIDRVIEGLAGAVEELREMSRGIHPAVLTEGGLSPALKALGRRSPVRVKLDIQTEQRLADSVEVAAYYVVSEALTNASKHAGATRVWVTLLVENETLRLSIRDDGAGGADPSRGSGLIGLADRVGALQGMMEIESPPGGGTRIDVGLPLPAGGTPAGR
jgi:signal transduction histidine kinase